MTQPKISRRWVPGTLRELPDTRRKVGDIYEYDALVRIRETVVTLDTPAPEPPAFPAKTADMLYYQRGAVPVPVLEAGQSAPRDGSLYIAVANSIDDDYEEPNTPTVGTEATPNGLRLWWNHEYRRTAGTRAVFQRFDGNAGYPVGLLPYANRTLWGLLDFVMPTLSLGSGGDRLFTTYPLEVKAHDFWGRATVQCNLSSNGDFVWATGYDGMTIEQTPVPFVPGKLHRMTWQMDMTADPTKGRFQASMDGVQAVDMRGQMALASGKWAGCAAFIPCLYSNQLNARTVATIPNIILSTAPIAA